MAIENDFLPFAAASGANVLTQAAYAAMAALPDGFTAGVADAPSANKIWRQASIMAAVIAAFIVAESGQPAIDDGTTATLQANLVAAIVAVVQSQFASPGFTGVPTAPTAAAATDSTQIATTAFVAGAIAAVNAAIAAANYATQTFVNDALANYLPKNNPIFTGTMTGPAYNT